jgi:hydrogenase maturation protein HypF|uniref:Carbamoyltransferase n=1 Tax=Desulfobacca acetoxidans TaxID=60893 RepID=A0A7V6A279_9BACT
MAEPLSAPISLVRKKLGVTGLVQGVGFRPFVYRLARSHNLAGWVRNTSRGVEIEVEGPPAALDLFIRKLSEEAPALSRVEQVVSGEATPLGQVTFDILASEHLPGTEAVIPPDVGLCPDCAREIRDPEDRRFQYPFTNCTNCGPRFTLIRQVPYDRPQTTMAVFEMCPACRHEYEDAMDRRFHAEPTACPACGPHAWLEYQGERYEKDVLPGAARLLREGKILAVKGLGGFHLACDAGNDAAVQALRERKGRRDKPFALMVRDLEVAARISEIRDQERSLLLSPERPIVLCRCRPGRGISPLVSPGNNYFGLLLPYTPLHLLLMEQAPDALVMTSGNLSEEPLVFTNAEARKKLIRLADAFLMHNRDIHVPCDDSVVRPLPDGTVIPLRRARGFVPQTIALPLPAPEILGLGAEQKNTFCLAWDHTALISQHIGDLDTLETFEYYQLAIRHFEALSRKRPAILAHDLHPHYRSSRYAREQEGVQLAAVQHHHAHVGACLAENGRTDTCLGLALDGTGYGPDGTVWGGEVLVADLEGFTRVGHLAPVRLPGGEAAIRNPARMAIAFLCAAFGDNFQEIAEKLGLHFPDLEWRILRKQLSTGWHSPVTTSAGRLLDAVAAATGICRQRTYEGQPALEVEMAADPGEQGFYPAEIKQHRETLIMDTPALFRGVVSDCLAGKDKAVIAGRFHQSLAKGLTEICIKLRERTGLNLIALSGGVFQNGLLLGNLKTLLDKEGFEVLTHRLVPPNDGGISLGQVAIAAAGLKER